MCINAIKTSIASFCVRNICHFQSLKRNVLICPLTHATLWAHNNTCTKMFHIVVAEEFNNLRPYLNFATFMEHFMNLKQECFQKKLVRFNKKKT